MTECSVLENRLGRKICITIIALSLRGRGHPGHNVPYSNSDTYIPSLFPRSPYPLEVLPLSDTEPNYALQWTDTCSTYAQWNTRPFHVPCLTKEE